MRARYYVDDDVPRNYVQEFFSQGCPDIFGTPTR